MTAKQARPPMPGAPESLVDSLQSEVAAEASPLLRFLVDNARYIALGIVAFILAIIGYWIFSWQAESRREEDIKALGQMLVIGDAKARLDKLEAFAASAPDSVKSAVWFAILEAAVDLDDADKQYAAWEEISRMFPEFKVTSSLGMAEIAARQGRHKEALGILDALSGGLSGAEVELVNTRIALLAEYLGEYRRGAAACDAILSAPGPRTEQLFWGQKKAALERLAQQAGPSGN